MTSDVKYVTDYYVLNADRPIVDVRTMHELVTRVSSGPNTR